MRKEKRQRLIANGWTVGSAEEFLGLTETEAALVELRIRLSDALKRRRIMMGFTQTALAEHIGSSQSRIAKMEAGTPSVSIDLILRALLSLGAGPDDLAKAIRTLAKAS